MFDGHYNEWRVKRVNFIEKLYGKSFFREKTILELGCGHGHIGRYLQNQLGAKVTFADARQEHLDVIKSIMLNADVVNIDQNKPWNLNRKFDLIIHWGVLYHLDDWRQDLECAANHSTLIFLESEVCDSEDYEYEIKLDAVEGYDQDCGLKSTRPSAAAVEDKLINMGRMYRRFDTNELNSDFHVYDWVSTNSGIWTKGQRRFWIVD